jgi:hypothetical protein
MADDHDEDDSGGGGRVADCSTTARDSESFCRRHGSGRNRYSTYLSHELRALKMKKAGPDVKRISHHVGLVTVYDLTRFLYQLKTVEFKLHLRDIHYG